MKKKIQIIVTLSIEGVHHWSNCPFQDVAFLKNKHRHLFHIRAIKQVSHSNRDVEIIMLKRSIETYIQNKYRNGYHCCNFGDMSCEMIADELLNEFTLNECEVLEDGENGARVVIDKL
jgi:hypothetical protein